MKSNSFYHKQETNYTCGAAAVRMALESCGIIKSEKQIVKLLGTNKVRGSWIKNFPNVFEKFKLDYYVGREGNINNLKAYLKKGYTIVINYFIEEEKVDHYSIVKNIDSKNIYLLDPWYGPEHKYKLSYFKKIWHSDKKYEKENAWFLAVKK